MSIKNTTELKKVAADKSTHPSSYYQHADDHKKKDIRKKIRLNAKMVQDYFSYRNIDHKFLAETLLYTVYQTHLKFAH